ncbi:hypothetical protein J2848_003003 [Azospirillum lipoferum]|uniref:Uncharacterized protein n=1 Tax=Azospirillum lipoferum TaxID=193 RepID=A0A5A9GQB6_AZOLI|nr:MULTISPECIES: hypothetical protein [Azospirillum]KAA0595794.1 hypothetical protein FZ942_15510 [Azospirillum lipoferum]MCP1611330.1 hypothetical protein [Azospirillum lipoferum]MDW5537134.1 hypothetical protein [Azospirillum sp. NL1]
MPSPRPPQPTRFAIQKARGKGWKTLEVGEELAHAKARFDRMVGVNPRAYFRLIQLDYNADSGYEGMEFNWTLIELYDPTQGPAKGPAQRPTGGGHVRPTPKPAATAQRKPGSKRKAGETVALPLRIYLAVILIGTLAGALAYLHFAGGR